MKDKKLDTTGWSKEKLEAYQQNLDKLKLLKEMEKLFPINGKKSL